VLSHHLPGHEEGAHTGIFARKKGIFFVGNNENFTKNMSGFLKIADFFVKIQKFTKSPVKPNM
jgi:hypothetical protein